MLDAFKRAVSMRFAAHLESSQNLREATVQTLSEVVGAARKAGWPQSRQEAIVDDASRVILQLIDEALNS